MCRLIIDVPFDIWGVVGTGWLSVVELAKLDSSMCAGDFRPEFLNECLSSTKLVYIGLSNIITTHDYLLWVSRRRIKVDRLTLNDSLNHLASHAERRLIFSIDLSAISNLEIESIDANGRTLLKRVLAKSNTSACGALTTMTCNGATVQDFMSELLSKCSNLKKFVATQCPDLADTHLFSMCNVAHKSLSDVTIQRCHSVSTAALTEFTGKCSRIAALHFSTNHVSNSLLRTFGGVSLKLLTTLNFSGSHIIATDVVQELCINSSSLSNLYLGSCHSMVNDDLLLKIGENCKNLTVIDISGSILVTDVGMESLCFQCRGLVAIHMHKVRRITAKTAWCIFKWLRSFKECTFGQKNKKTQKLLMACFIIMFDSLDELNLVSGNMRGVRNLCNTLTDFEQKYFLETGTIMHDVNDDHLENIDQFMEKLVTTTNENFAKNLIALTINSDTSPFYLLVIAHSCSCLKAVDFCSNVPIAVHGDMDVLEGQDLCLSDISLTRFLTTVGSSLLHINLQCCAQLTDTALFAVAAKCHNLVFLGCNMPHPLMNYSSAFSDDGVLKILMNCSKLARLYLKHSIKLTDNILFYIAEHCKNMTNLLINGCTQISKEAKIFLKMRCPRLKCHV